MFYGAAYWASVLCSATCFHLLDVVVVSVAQMAFQLEHSTSGEAVLLLIGVLLARIHVLRCLIKYMVRKD